MNLYVKLLLVLFPILLVSCKMEQPEVRIDFAKILYKNIAPVEHEVNSAVTMMDVPALKRVADLKYLVAPGDTLNVQILEFQSDVYAMDYYMNSGRFQGFMPILRGEYLEQSLRADSRIFIFKHDCFRRYERSDFETYVRDFPGFRGGFPQEFLSLPFEYREAGRTSIQTKFFMGVKAVFPVLVQSYRNEDMQWNVARSWDQVEQVNFNFWTSQLTSVKPRNVDVGRDVFYFDAGNKGNGMAKRLAGGRVVVVWGYLSWEDLAKKFKVASDRIYEARF